jgi:AcrR family transcriptional regulator
MQNNKTILPRPGTLTRSLVAKNASPADEANDRRQEILNVAADLFARHGFDGVGVRQIADAAGILGGSLYHHFSSKRDLYVEVHGAALAHAALMIEEAIGGLTDPWERLEAACSVHLALQLDPHSLTMPMMSDHAAMKSEMRVDLIRDRDRFETIYKRLIAALPLNPQIDRNIYRLCLVSLINTVPVWYRSGRLSVDEVAGQIVTIFRESSAGAAKPRQRPRSTSKATRKSSR